MEGVLKPSFSEFQFAYFVTREMDDWHIWPYGPYIPNQVDEGSCGFDVALLNDFVAIFLQYKLSDKLTVSRAREWGDFGREYFRFLIYPDNRSAQHNNLCCLSHRNTRNKVYYCAPLFIDYRDLIDCYRDNNLLNHSVFVDCSCLPTISGSEKHCICYTEDSLFGYMYSAKSSTIKIKKGIDGLYDRANVYRNFSEFIEGMNKFFIEVKSRERDIEEMEIPFCTGKDTIQSINNYLLYNDLHLFFVHCKMKSDV
jgi:hypothetical protein